MKILLITPHFYPETFKCNELAFELARRGHKVEVMTAIPDYPEGHFLKGYGIFKRRKEVINGVTIRRSLIIPRGNGSAIRLALNYLSYTFFASLKALWHGISKKHDLILVHETSPVLVGIPAVIIKKLTKTPIFFWVLDLWPESLSAAGGIHNKTILGIFDNITRFIYKNSHKILVGSKGFKKSIAEKGVDISKIEYFPYWRDEITPSDTPLPPLPDSGFNIVFTGNMGEAQDFPHVMEAARRLKSYRDINFILVGDGRKREWIEKFIAENKLKNVFLPGRFPVEMMPAFYEKASLLFMALKDSPIFRLTVPAKIQSYMAAGKPILAMISGEGANLINEADCGWTVDAEDSDSLVNTIYKLYNTDSEILAKKGANGLNYSNNHFRFMDCVDLLERIISNY